MNRDNTLDDQDMNAYAIQMDFLVFVKAKPKNTAFFLDKRSALMQWPQAC
jgi:hypothetical protein